MEFASDLRSVTLVTWDEPHAEKLAIAMGLRKGVQLRMTGTNNQISVHWEGTELSLTASDMGVLPGFIEEYGLQVRDTLNLMEQIDRKIAALQELKTTCAKLVPVVEEGFVSSSGYLG